MEYHDKLWDTRHDGDSDSKYVRECEVVDGSGISGWFMIKSGVKQGCVTSVFLFLTEHAWRFPETKDGLGS